MGSSIDGVVKALAEHDSVIVMMAWRFVFGAVLTLSVFIALRKKWPKANALRFHAFRGAIQASAAVLFFWSVTQLALAEATTLGFTAALLIAPLAWLVLGERMTALDVCAAAIGFVGAVFAVSGEADGAPDNANRVLGALACLLAAALYAATLVLMRLRTREEDALTIVTMANLFCALWLSPVLVWTFPGIDPTRLPLYAGLGLGGVATWLVFTIAYANADAQKLAPLEYTALLWGGLIGYWAFQETPDWRLYPGAALIIAACTAIAVESRFATRRAAKSPAADPGL